MPFVFTRNFLGHPTELVLVAMDFHDSRRWRYANETDLQAAPLPEVERLNAVCYGQELLIERLRARIEELEGDRVSAVGALERAGTRLGELVAMTVHVLHEGRALCGFPGLPGSWPHGHNWVRLGELSEATCSQCKADATAQTATAML